MSEHVAEQLIARKSELAVAVTDAVYAAVPELASRYGPEGRRKCEQDMHYTLEHLAPAVELGEPAMFATYVGWLRDMLQRRNVPPTDVVATLHAMASELPARLGADAALDACLAAGLAELSAEVE